MEFQELWEKFHSGYTIVDECWLWHRCLTSDGYGVIRVDGKTEYAHRLSLKLHGIDIPDGYDTCHKCPKKARNCVNPEHLYAGTRAQNVADMISDGTLARGEKHHNHKLTEAQVLEIRQRRAEGSRVLSKEFSVTPSAVCRIFAKRRWKHL